MPSITTHYIFSKDVLNNLPKESVNKIANEIDLYHTFSQSHDILFYYFRNLKKRKEINKLGHYAHHNKTQEYLINIIKEIKNNHLENNQQLVAYLYGSITHYVLDSTCHPYIFYKTGVYRKEDKKTQKYKGQHNVIEKHLDAIYYEKTTNKKYNTCNINKYIINNKKISKDLIKSISNVYKETYNKNNIGKYFYQSIKDTKIFNAFIVNDYFGIKKIFLKIFDLILKKNFSYLSIYSNHITKPNYEYLNLKQKIWNHPSNPNIKFNYSFDDLWHISLKKSIKIIKEVNKVLYDNKDISEILKYIPNLDYATGLVIEKSSRMAYFEY